MPAVAGNVDGNSDPDNKITNGAHYCIRPGLHTVILMRKNPTDMHSIVTNVFNADHGMLLSKHVVILNLILKLLRLSISMIDGMISGIGGMGDISG